MTTTPAPPRRKPARLLSWFSTGHDRARSNRPSTPVLARRSSPIDPAMPLGRGSLLRANLPTLAVERSARTRPLDPSPPNPHSARGALARGARAA